MAPMPLVDFLADDYYTGTIAPRYNGGKVVALSKGLVQWVLGGMFYQVLRGMVNARDRNGEAMRHAKPPADEVLRALPTGV